MLLKTLWYIANHPFNKGERTKSIIRFFKWQIGSRLLGYPVLYNFTEHSKLLIQRGETGSTGNLYCGLLEFNDMAFLLHLLRKEDLFVDIGANVGVYTILASAEIGSHTIAIEPIPSTFEKLQTNIKLNDIGNRTTSLQLGLGREASKLYFTTNQDTTNHVITEGETNHEVVEVEVKQLDKIMKDQNPILLKIDVEGFETEVLAGANEVLENKQLKAIIIELNGSGEKYGYNEEEIHRKLMMLGFKAHQYEPYSRRLKEIETYGNFNTIYIRDLDYVEERLKKATAIKVRNKLI